MMMIRDNILPQVVQVPCGEDGPSVFLMRCSVFDGEVCGQYEASCSVARRERAGRYRMMNDRVRCLAAGWLVRYAAGLVLGMEGVNESHDLLGRPFLPQAPGHGLSITHSGCWVACGLYSGGSVGIDIEFLSHPAPGLAEVFMSPEELIIYRRCTGDPDRREFFLRHWCLKESWLKATGTGLTRNPTTITIHPRGSVMAVRSEALPAYWHTHEKWLDDGALLTICWK